MSDRLPDHGRRPEVAPFGWRLVQFVVLTLFVLFLEQVLETWLLPGPSAELAVEQLEPSDGAAAALRLHETFHAFLPSVTALAIFFIGLSLFVPGYGRNARRVGDSGDDAS